MKYRADIDGLRAIAVLSVVLFHLEISTFSGGYVGVDIFFVISGYLISSIIKTKNEAQNFSLSDFYFRRIRRLLPALFATIAGTLIASAFILSPYDMVGLSKSATAAVFSLSNIAFFQESGYWDTESSLKPLLHTWSLGVEEQFYLFWPLLILYLLHVRQRMSLLWSLGFISIGGAALSIWYTGINQDAAFYLLPFRIFQFATGAMIIPLVDKIEHLPSQRKYRLSSAIFWVGLITIVASILAIDDKTAFPGWAILWPTVGAALVLLAGAVDPSSNRISATIMENPVSIWLGKVSYSMYLVHWPVISLYRYSTGVELTIQSQLLLATATLALTVALHYLIERRYYARPSSGPDHTRPSSNGSLASRTILAGGLLGIISSSAWLGDGWSWRFPTLSLTTVQIESGNNNRYSRLNEACRIQNWESNRGCKNEAETQVFILGNSHEPDGFNFLNAGYGTTDDLNLIIFGTTNRCPNIWFNDTGFINDSEECQQRLDVLSMPEFVKSLDVVFYAANIPYAANKSGLLAMLRKLKDINPSLQVIIMGGYINTKRECSHYIVETGTSDSCVLQKNVTYFANNPEAQPLCSEFRALESHYVDRVALLCQNRLLETCLSRTTEGIPMVSDVQHQSLEFAEMSGEMYARKFPELLSGFAE
jgi:peptidoglycan/LPS O-acetylase OafA/YrhL